MLAFEVIHFFTLEHAEQILLMLQKTAITSKGPIEYRLEGVDALAGLLNELQIPIVDVIGISAAGPTALAFAQQHSSKLRKLILESAVTTRWDDQIKILPRLGFGPIEKATWSLIKLVLKITPNIMIRTMVQQLTTLDVNEVLSCMNKADLLFVRRMIETSRSGTGFLNDIEHYVDDLSGIVAPVLVIYSPKDKFVPEKNAVRVAVEVKRYELYEVPADTHLIWIGKATDDVWLKRLFFLRSQ